MTDRDRIWSRLRVSCLINEKCWTDSPFIFIRFVPKQKQKQNLVPIFLVEIRVFKDDIVHKISQDFMSR